MDTENLETIYDRLEWALHRLGKTPNAASIELGFKSRNMIREALNRKRSPTFSSTLLIRLWEHYKINPNWILLGKGKPFLKD